MQQVYRGDALHTASPMAFGEQTLACNRATFSHSAAARKPPGRLTGNESKQCRSENKLSHLASFGDFESQNLGESAESGSITENLGSTPISVCVPAFRASTAIDSAAKLVTEFSGSLNEDAFQSTAGHCLDHSLTFINCYYD